jgi:hypothetical protein
MLSVAKADIVFLFDESHSGEDLAVWSWLQAAIPILQSSFDVQEIDARYGLIGFGQSGRLAHSQIVNTSVAANDPLALFGTASQLGQAIVNFESDGSQEDGWDAIEHAIAEYDIRDGAVPV